MDRNASQQRQPVFIPPLEVCNERVSSASLEQWPKRLSATLAVWWQRYRRRASLRRQLRELDIFRAEQDVGLPSGSLLEEAGKAFWRE